MCTMLGLPQLQKTLNQTTDLIHPGLLQLTEVYRSLKRELALSTFGFLYLFHKYKKKKSISIQVAWCFPTQKSVMLCFWDLFITCYSQRVTSPGYSQATPWVPVQSLMPSLSRSPQLNLLSLQLCSNSQINPEIWKAASKWSHPQELASSFSQWRDGRVSTHHLIELKSRCSTLTTLSFIVRIRLWHSWDNPMKIIMVVRVDS